MSARQSALKGVSVVVQLVLHRNSTCTTTYSTTPNTYLLPYPSQCHLLGFFCDAAQESQRRQILDALSPMWFKLSSMKLAQHLHRVGKTTDARAVVDSAVNILRRGRQLPSTALRGIEGRFIKRKATRREIEAGVPVDASGYMLPDDVLNDAERKS
jgi:hypothetical protein